MMGFDDLCFYVGFVVLLPIIIPILILIWIVKMILHPIYTFSATILIFKRKSWVVSVVYTTFDETTLSIHDIKKDQVKIAWHVQNDKRYKFCGGEFKVPVMDSGYSLNMYYQRYLLKPSDEEVQKCIDRAMEGERSWTHAVVAYVLNSTNEDEVTFELSDAHSFDELDENITTDYGDDGLLEERIPILPLYMNDGDIVFNDVKNAKS